MELSFVVLPNSLELFLSRHLDLFSHWGCTQVSNCYFLNLAWSSIEIFGELIFEAEGEYVWNRGHPKLDPINPRFSHSELKTNSIIRTHN